MDVCFLLVKEIEGYRVCPLLQKARMAMDSALIRTRVFVDLRKHLELTSFTMVSSGRFWIQRSLYFSWGPLVWTSKSCPTKTSADFSSLKPCSLDLYSWNVVLTSLLFLGHIRHSLAWEPLAKRVFFWHGSHILSFSSLWSNFIFRDTAIVPHLLLPPPTYLLHFSHGTYHFPYYIIFLSLSFIVHYLFPVSLPLPTTITM